MKGGEGGIIIVTTIITSKPRFWQQKPSSPTNCYDVNGGIRTYADK